MQYFLQSNKHDSKMKCIILCQQNDSSWKEYSVGWFLKWISSGIQTPFLLHESEDRKTSLFPKFYLIPILCFQVMHDYVVFIGPLTNVLNQLSLTIILRWTLLWFHTEMISAYTLWGNVLLKEELQNEARKWVLKKLRTLSIKQSLNMHFGM